MGIARSATAVAIRDNDAAGTAVNVTNNAATTVGVSSIGTDGKYTTNTNTINSHRQYACEKRSDG